MALPSFINTQAPEPSLARWTSLINDQPQPFPVLFVGDTKAYQWFFHDDGTIASFSGLTGYTLKVSVGPIDSGPTSGTFTLTCGETTDPLQWDASALDIENALNALATVIAFGGVNVQGEFPNFMVYSNELGVVTAITADASLLAPDSTITASILTTGTVSVRQQTYLILRRNAMATSTTWSRITTPYNGWSGNLILTTEGAKTLLAQEGILIGGYYQAETLLTVQVILDSDSAATTYYQTTVLVRGKVPEA